MKNSVKNKTEKSVIQELRELRDKVNLEIKDMTSEQLKEYFNKKKTLHPASAWKKAARQDKV